MIVFARYTTGSTACFRFSAALQRVSWCKIHWKGKISLSGCSDFNLFSKRLIIWWDDRSFRDETYKAIMRYTSIFSSKCSGPICCNACHSIPWKSTFFNTSHKSYKQVLISGDIFHPLQTKWFHCDDDSFIKSIISNCAVSWLSVFLSSANENKNKFTLCIQLFC